MTLISEIWFVLLSCGDVDSAGGMVTLLAGGVDFGISC